MSDTPPIADELPSFDPQGTEQISSIPSRFLVDGILRLRTENRWTFRGELIEHVGVRRFLARQLRRTEEGTYWVVNGPQRVVVEVEETPYFVTMLRVEERDGVKTLIVRLNDQSEEPLPPERLFRGLDERLFVTVKEGLAGALPGTFHVAALLREAVMPLEPLLCELDAGEGDASDPGIGLDVNGQIYAIPQQPLPPISGV